jgi:hypothetical protein
MNDNALKHINDNINAYDTTIKGICAVKGLGQGKNSYACKMNTGVDSFEYIDTLRLLVQKLSSTFKKIAKNDLKKIIFELDEYYLILIKKTKTRTGTPLFLSILAAKTEGLAYAETIIEELADDLFLILR